MSAAPSGNFLAGDRPTGRAPGFLARYLARFDDGALVRWVFRGMLVGTIGVLGMDAVDLWQRNGGLLASPADDAVVVQPLPPPAVTVDRPEGSPDPRKQVRTEAGTLARPMRFELGAGGVLTAQGSILPGTAKRFAEEIAARGEYVKTVALDSPGGALDDAMEMARLIRARGLGTDVPDGAVCASSCPLVLAGGVTRRAGRDAAIGVHQFYAATAMSAGPEQAMADAQATTARISRHLAGMGVDPAAWLHALDTPPRSLYFFSAAELKSYRLVTQPLVASRQARGVSGS